MLLISSVCDGVYDFLQRVNVAKERLTYKTELGGEIKGESDGNGRAGPGLLISSIHFRSPKTHVCSFCGTENTCLPLSVPNLEMMHSGIGMWLNLPIKASYSAL